MRYLDGYPPAVLDRVRALIAQQRLYETVSARYPAAHEVRNDRALQSYVADLKTRHLRSAPPLAKVEYDHRLHGVHRALGTHTAVSRVQGSQLKAQREIRIAGVFKDALYRHMAPDYHQLEFDTRLWLTALDLEGAGHASSGRAPSPS